MNYRAISSGWPIRWVVLPCLLAVSASSFQDVYGQVQIGDANGDGVVSYSDAVRLNLWRVFGIPALEPPTGSELSRYDEVFPCTASSRHYSHLTYYEYLRRVSDSRAAHFVERWPDPVEQIEPRIDPAFRLEILDSVHDSSTALVTLVFRLEAIEKIHGFSLVVFAEGVQLRPAEAEERETDDLVTHYEGYQMTGGHLPFRTGSAWSGNFLEVLELEAPRETFRVTVDVPRGTVPGRYPLRVVAAELATLDGRSIWPATVDGTLELMREIGEGHDLSFPELNVDPVRREIKGRVELRFTEASGAPGDRVATTLQIRTTIPISSTGRLGFVYDAGSVEVVAMKPLYRNPEDGEINPDHVFTEFFGAAPPPFSRSGLFTVGFDPRRNVIPLVSDPYDGWESRSIYLPPTQNWTDLAEIVFEVRDSPLASGKIVFERRPSREVIFDPYFPINHNIREECRGEANLWRYPGLEVIGNFFTVLTDDAKIPAPPIDPSKAGIRYELGTASASPGDEVRVPVRVTSLVDLYLLRMVFGYPSDTLEFVGFDVERTDANGDAPEVLRLTPADNPRDINQLCAPEGGGCRAGLPYLSILRGPPLDEVPEETIIIDLSTTYLLGGGLGTPGPLAWEAGEVHDLGALVFRVRPGATAASARIEGREVTWRPESPPAEITSSTSGFPILEDPPEGRGDVPAIAVLGGEVSIGGTFLRADSTQNGAIEISDPVRTLGALFLGDPVPPCPDAEDANDDGEVNLSDAVYTLSFLFLGGPAPPAPYPEPGSDPTADGLTCP